MADHEKLKQNQQFKLSCGELELLPYVQQAIKQTEDQLQNLRQFKTTKSKSDPATTQLNLGSKQKSLQDLLPENNEDFFYFYQSSSGENLFLHPICMKLLHQEFNQDFSRYPLQLSSKVDEIEYDLLLLESMQTQAKKYKYLDFLPDNTPFGMIEIDMRPLVKARVISDEVYQDNQKHLQARHRNRQKKMKGEETYNNSVKQLQDKQFEQYKQKALSHVGGGGYVVIKNSEYKHQPVEEEAKSEPPEEEEQQDETPIDIEKYTEEEEKQREIKQNQSKATNGWSKLEQQWGTNSGQNSRKTSNDEYGEWLTKPEASMVFEKSKETKLKERQMVSEIEKDTVQFSSMVI